MRLGFVKPIIFALSLIGATFAALPSASAAFSCKAPDGAAFEGEAPLDFATYYKVSAIVYLKDTPQECKGSGSTNFEVAKLVLGINRELPTAAKDPESLNRLLKSSQALNFKGSSDDHDLNTAREYALLRAKTFLQKLQATGKNADQPRIAAALGILDPGGSNNTDRAVPGGYAILGGAKSGFESTQQAGAQAVPLSPVQSNGALMSRGSGDQNI